MREYVPTTGQVRGFWASDGKHQPAAKSYDYIEAADEFDRWLAKHDRDVKAEALEEAASSPIPREVLTNGTRAWLRARAAEYRKGKNNE